MLLTICALSGCGKPVGVVPYRMLGKPEEFCSKGCVDQAWGHRLKKSKPAPQPEPETEPEEPSMEVPADDFGDAGVVRHFCDRPECRKPIALSWKGRYGSYCSNTCLKISEKEDQIMSDETNTNAAPDS